MTKFELPKYNGKYVYDEDCWTTKLMHDCTIFKRIPIYVPSYNRYNEGDAVFLSVMRDYSSWPVYIIVRESQASLYEKTYNRYNMYVVPVPDEEITDAGLAHAKCIDLCSENELFIIDDDIIPYVNVTAKNKETNVVKSMPLYTIDNFDHVFNVWQYVHHYLLDKYSNCCCTTIEDNVFNFNEHFLYDFSYIPHKFMCGVCFDKRRIGNLNYRSCAEYGHDDIDFMFNLAENKMFPLSIKLITFKANKYGAWGYESLEDRLIEQFNMLKEHWESCPYAKIDENKLVFTVDFKKFFKQNNDIVGVDAKRNLCEELGYTELKSQKISLW